MKAKTRRAVVRDLGLMTLGSLVGPDLFAAGVAEPAAAFTTTVSKSSICVFLDGSWLLRATDSNFMALTTDDKDNCYTQAIWKPCVAWEELKKGNYEVAVFREHAGCTCAADLLAAQSNFLPYLRDVQCIFEPTPSGSGASPGPDLRIISLPTPDKLHTAARIRFQASDYQGTDCSSGHNFKAPQYLSTVVILEYTNATALAVMQKTECPSGSVLLQKASPGQHYHFRTSLRDPTSMDGPTEERHIKCFTTSLAGQLRHKADGSAVSFWIDPAEIGNGDELNPLKGVSNVSRLELGMADNKENCLNSFKDLANCAGGILGG
jgi:hypothetical protein